jgi:DNA-binding NarL/FixJ family response regulator
MINVILADHQRIFRVGMASALAAEDDIRIVGQPHSVSQLLYGLEQFRAHVLVLSSAFFANFDRIKQAADRQHTAILLLEDTAALNPQQSMPEADGVMRRSADESTAVRCVRHLARGGRVLHLVSHHAVRVPRESVQVRVRQRLSRLELRVIAMVLRGLKNREIASQLGCTEQGAKNTLRKIFDKTGVSDRLELALFVMHHNIVVRDVADASPFRGLRALAAVPVVPETANWRSVN